MMNHHARINMIKQQLRAGDVLDEKIIVLYEELHRHEFVPEHMQHFAYSDMHIPLKHDQCMMTPLEEGRLLQSLHLKGHEVVLEVGTGSGFLTALLSKQCKHVISVDYYPEFTRQAEKALSRHDCANVELITGDACMGWIEKAPYDVIVFTGTLEHIDKTIALQLLPQGKLFAIRGKAPIMQACVYQLQNDNSWQSHEVYETFLPPLIDKYKPKEFIF